MARWVSEQEYAVAVVARRKAEKVLRTMEVLYAKAQNELADLQGDLICAEREFGPRPNGEIPQGCGIDKAVANDAASPLRKRLRARLAERNYYAEHLHRCVRENEALRTERISLIDHADSLERQLNVTAKAIKMAESRDFRTAAIGFALAQIAYWLRARFVKESL